MRRRLERQLPIYCVTGACLAWVMGVVAQDNTGVTVSGRGKIKAAPNLVEINGTVIAEAELTGDALTKFRTAKESALVAMKKLGFENLSVDSTGFGIGPAPGGDPTTLSLNRIRGTAPEPPKVSVQESFRLRLRQIDKMDREKLMDALAKIIDTAKESGVTFGPPSPARLSITQEYIGYMTFSVEDAQSLREQAELLAVQDARAKAERLVKLNGGRLGEVRTISESQLPYMPTSSLRPTPPDQPARLDDVEINVVLQVQFKWGT